MSCNKRFAPKGSERLNIVAVCLSWLRLARRPAFLSALVFAGCLGTAAVARAQMTLVVDRSETYVEVFLSLEAARLEEVFALPPSALLSGSGQVAFASIREDGSFDIGDEMFEDVFARIGGARAEFEAMSLMLHPLDAPLRLKTPLDGLIAIEVCSVPTEDLPGTLDTLQAYAGFIAYTDTPDAALMLELPATGRGDVVLEIRDHAGGRLVGLRTIVVPDGGRILTDPTAYKTAGLLHFGWLLLPALLGLGIAMIRRGASNRVASAKV